jgi:YD repeat-containing protein
MAYNDTSTVNAATNNSDMAAPVLLYNSAGAPTFVRNSPTVYAYTWNANGRITNITQAGSGPVPPTGCVVSG